MESNPSNLRVAFITTGYPTTYRPNECIFIHRSIKVLSEVVHPIVVHLRALKPGRPLVEKRVWDGIDVLSISCPQLPLGSYSHFNTQLMEYFGEPLVRKAIKSAGLVHAAEAYPAGYVSGKWSQKYGLPFTFNVIGSDLNLFLKKNYSRIGRQWLTNLRGAICNSNSLQKNLNQLMGELPTVRTIYRGVDTEVFSPEGVKAGPQAILPPVRFLYLGGFHTWNPLEETYNLKGGHTLLNAWRRIDCQLSLASLVIGGPGVYRDQLWQWQAKLTNPERFFCVNSIDPSDIANYIRASDVVIIPSLSEGLPNLAKEALACGRPVLGTNVGGIPEVVEHGKTGLIIPPDNSEALSAGIKWFCDNQEQIITMGNNGRSQMKEFFSWEQYKHNTIDFWESTVGKNLQGH